MKRLAVLGAGSWGTALAIALAARFEAVCLWARDAGQAMTIAAQRENARYLAGFRIPGHVEISHDLQRTISGADIVLSVVPSRYLRGEDSLLSIVQMPKGDRWGGGVYRAEHAGRECHQRH